MAAIARGAGVSVESVKAAGSKADLLLSSFEQTFAGDEGPRPIGERPEIIEITRITDPSALLDALITFVTEANRRSYGLWQTFIAAADQEPGVRDRLRDLLERRRQDIRGAVHLLADRGLVTPGTDLARAADSWNFLLSPEGYEQLVAQSGWDLAEYRPWVRAAIEAMVLRPPQNDVFRE
ncbi:TetR family transcriptional regulator [Nakamurella silvestris]|nr:TetR family transcriptional regulator [Nakamurella silvestris]